MRHTLLIALCLLTLNACSAAPPKVDGPPTKAPSEGEGTDSVTAPEQGEKPEAVVEVLNTKKITEFDPTDPQNKLTAIPSPFSAELSAKQKAWAAKIPAVQKDNKAFREATLKALKTNDYATLQSFTFDPSKDGPMYCPEDQDIKRRAKPKTKGLELQAEQSRRNALALCVTMNIGQATLISDATNEREGTSFRCTKPYKDTTTYLRYLAPDGTYFSVNFSSSQFSSPSKTVLNNPPRCRRR